MEIDVPTVHRLHNVLNAIANGDRVAFNRTDGSAGVVARPTGIIYATDGTTDLMTAFLTARDDAGDSYVWSIEAVLDGYERGIFSTYSVEPF